MFKEGQKVVCKHNFSGISKTGWEYPKTPPKKNEVYTFNGTHPIYTEFIYLKEHINDCCWHSKHFEPLSDLTIDEAINKVRKQPETV